ncbi:Methyl-accepting chemotaxis protein McpQ [Pseudomonas fluorescens]|uniref:Methyl-accepting chemotaxis protein McpQ n=1 Tax=Pseudomonas fluorescens TaxID=294 RepID=A0A5E7P4M8_PSEFL|nr:Methyl-accepting chemotaxis protein McpQ [Pseudomonas fluorescens]VVP44291.1 Methyl-accepting chemotaxis protein McpQ [Pseudomonas fluorescens]
MLPIQTSYLTLLAPRCRRSRATLKKPPRQRLPLTAKLAAAAEQQSAVAEEISRSIINVRDVSEQTAAASDETAASSVELARLGNQLQMMVSHFRL